MMKWVALALGALLALGGAVSIWNGVDIIQSERGWVAVIAGSVALVGGVLTFALFILIREVQALRAILLSDADLPLAPVAESAPEFFEAPASSPPVFHEPAASPPAPVEPPPAPLASPVPAQQVHEPGPVAALAHESPTFAQVFPPAPAAPQAPARARFQPSEAAAVGGVAAGAAAIGMFARSRIAQPAVQTPAASAPEADHEVGREPVEPPVEAQPHPEPVQAPDRFEASPAHGAEEPSAPIEASQVPVDEGAQDEQPADADESQTPTVSPGYAWLERALARDEGRKSPALEWLRSHPPTGSLNEPAPSTLEEAPAAEREPSEPQEQEGAGPSHEEHPQEEGEAGPAQEPGVVGRYSSGDSHYTLYSDGSIDAQTDQGIFRFASMADLRAHIEAGAAES